MNPEVKICGITKAEEVSFLNEMPVDYIGFVFAPSKRKVTPEMAADLAKGLRRDIKKVGVFTGMSLEEIGRIVESCNLDIVQLHGVQSDTEISSLGCPVWKGIPMLSKDSVHKLVNYPSAEGFILDTYVPDKQGGTGRTFHWEWAEGLSMRYRIILAGGLNAENISRAMQLVKPHILDVSSGVEGPNGKDRLKVAEFIKAVKKYEA